MKKSLKTTKCPVQDIKPSTLNYFKDESFTPFDSIPKGGFRSTDDVYRTKFGNGFFKFRFYWIGSYYEIDILAMPSYNSRLSDDHSTHRRKSARGGYKVCFGDESFLTTLSEAKKWAGVWSELTMKYIIHGTQIQSD